MSEDKIERIKAAYARDQRERPQALKFGDIPFSYDAITAQWLTAVLCRNHPGAAVSGFALQEPDNGTSNRRRIRLSFNSIGESAGLPKSIFCKATQDLTNRLLLSASATFSEVSFYNRVRPLLNIDAPVSYFAAYDPESWASIIVLKDIGAEVQFCSQDTLMDRTSVESQLTLLAAMHGHFHGSPEFAGALADLIPFHRRFRNLADRYGIKECCENGVVAAEAVIPARLFSRKEQIWAATLRSVDRQAASPETFVHGDVHLKNWYVRGAAGMGLGDWQCSGRGHWARDVAYTVSTSLTTAQRRALEQDLLRYYLTQLHASGGPRIAFDQAWRDYREQLLSALAWWTMTLTPGRDMPDMQPRETTLVFIGRIAAAMDDLDSIGAGN